MVRYGATNFSRAEYILDAIQKGESHKEITGAKAILNHRGFDWAWTSEFFRKPTELFKKE